MSDPGTVLKPPRPRPVQARGLKRLVFLSFGCLFVAIAVAGALLPGIPTTPWVLSAAYCFDRSSDRFSRWLRRAPVFGKLIADWERYRGIRRPIKVMAVCTVVTVVSLSIIFSGLPVFVKWMIGVWACIGVCTIVFVVPTAKIVNDNSPPVVTDGL
ncbi:YbaN family protein [Limnoglobus roseus]|uniref:DUF454 domain-containing protein n=1 Tax=Limnoglobus roseus TaxID=2598579 RepID=A0A5C1A8X2_9BACT|nr:YbaN family protein [Limnoglobus roseus]QEL14486.1 hypothetical protein PX52LOC_01375 [Limnoglobus roseus]